MNRFASNPMDERIATPAGKKLYRRRNWIAETPFAIIKAIMNLRGRGSTQRIE